LPIPARNRQTTGKPPGKKPADHGEAPHTTPPARNRQTTGKPPGKKPADHGEKPARNRQTTGKNRQETGRPRGSMFDNIAKLKRFSSKNSLLKGYLKGYPLRRRGRFTAPPPSFWRSNPRFLEGKKKTPSLK
jgi:hypothetical protein